MPSQVTDDLWHEFILYTRNYEDFCRRAFGRFRYVPDCSALRAGGDGSAYCGGDFNSSSVDGSTDGFGDAGSSPSGDGGGGGGDGGGCGGGCGGD